MANLILMRGLPASGKSTMAKRFNEAPTTVVLSKDAIRKAMYPKWEYSQTDLFLIEDLRDIAMKQHLEQGYDVVIDETFIEVEDINRLLTQIDVGVYIFDLTAVPFELCLLRNYERQHQYIPIDAMLDARARMEENAIDFEGKLVRECSFMTMDPWRWEDELRSRLASYQSLPLSQGTRVSYSDCFGDSR